MADHWWLEEKSKKLNLAARKSLRNQHAFFLEMDSSPIMKTVSETIQHA